MPDATKSPVNPADESKAFTDALARLLPKITAIPERELIAMNLDVLAAVLVGLQVGAFLRSIRDEVRATFVDPPLDVLDELEDYARAAALADARYQGVIGSPAQLPAVNARAIELRDALLTAAEALVPQQIFPAERVATVRAGIGYRDTLSDLLTLAEMYRAVWDKIDGRTFVTRAQIDEAHALAYRLMGELSKRDQTDPEVVAAALLRRQAVTAYVRKYDQARRVATYVRWPHGDVDDLLPTLYVRSAPAARKRDDDKPASDAAAPAKPVVAAPARPAQPASPAPPPDVPQDGPFLPKS